jgi:hypothetical protein
MIFTAQIAAKGTQKIKPLVDLKIAELNVQFYHSSTGSATTRQHANLCGLQINI